MSLSRTCRNLRLENSNELVADCLDEASGEYRESRLQLKERLSNHSGKFHIHEERRPDDSWSREDDTLICCAMNSPFHLHYAERRPGDDGLCLGSVLRGTVLDAKLRAQVLGGTKRDQVDLEKLIRNVKGSLTWAIDPSITGLTTYRGLRLENSTLIGECLDYSGRYQEARMDLDAVLGNADGCFDIGGHNFSKSARRQSLVGTTLRAELKPVARPWVERQIDLAACIENVGGRLIWCTGSVFWRTSLETSCRNFGLDYDTKAETDHLGPPGINLALTADCCGHDGRWKYSRLDLNSWLGNCNGKFQVPGRNVSHSISRVSLRQTSLQALLTGFNGHSFVDMLDLRRHVGNHNGSLVNFQALKFNYAPLAISRPEIRLLKLSARIVDDSTRADGITFSMVTIPLESDVSFDALSYCWGSDKDKVLMNVDGRTIAVTRNLYNALHIIPFDMKDGYTSRYIWVDAICVDQDNLTERSQQVNLMRDIYSRAKTVHVWLGLPTTGTWQLFEAIRDMHAHSSSSEDVVPADRPWNFASALRHLISLDWWKRVWVIQEVHLARSPVLWCGNNGPLPLRTLMRVFLRLQATWRIYGIAACMGSNDDIPERLNRLMFVFAAGAQAADPIPWIQAVNWNCQCSDPKDRIFGLLGLLPSLGVEVDYTQDVERVYSRSLVKIMRHTSSLMLLQLAGLSNSTPGWPSWIVDFRNVHGANLTHTTDASAGASFYLQSPNDKTIIVRAWIQNITAYENCVPDTVYHPPRDEMLSNLRKVFLSQNNTDMPLVDHKAAVDLARRLKANARLLQPSESPSPYQHAPTDYNGYWQGSLFRTELGRIGAIKHVLHTNDVLAVLAGSRVPFILRRMGSNSFTIIGQCYCDGVTSGEAARAASKAKADNESDVDSLFQEIELHETNTPLRKLPYRPWDDVPKSSIVVRLPGGQISGVDVPTT